MSLEEQKIRGYASSISALPDKIENKAAWLKSRFDARTDGEVKEKHNGLVDALKSPEAGEELGLRVEGLTAATAAGAARELLLKETAHEGNRENPHGVTAAQTGAYTRAETERRLLEKVTEIGAGDMAKAVYDPDGDGKILDDTKLPLAGGTLTGRLYAPDYATSRKDGSYYLDAGISGGKKIDYRLHANDGAFWAHRYENGQPKTAPIMITAAGVCNINGHADQDLPLAGGTLTGDLHAPHYLTSVADGSYFLNAGTKNGKKVDYRLHAIDGAFWLHRYENGTPVLAPMTITASGYCDINGCAGTATQIQAGANYLKPRWEGTVGVLDVDNAKDLAWNKARYLTPDSTSSIAAEWSLSGTWAFCPRADAVHPLGLAFKRWNGAYLTSSPSVTSDRREKHDIAALDTEKAAAFVAALKPAAYKYNDGTSGRTHWGLIAQDVEEAMEACGISDMEFAGLIKAERPKGEKAGEETPAEYSYSLRYEEFIAPLIALAQRQEKQLEEQKQQTAALRERVAALEKEREEK